MSVYESAFEEALKSKLEDVFYTYLNRLDKEGAWGVLFRIYSKIDDEIRVVKVYKDSVDENNIKIYSKDAQKLKKYQDANIVRAHDIGFIDYKDEKFFFIILDYIKGKSLEDIDVKIYWEIPYDKRIITLNQALETIGIFRTKYEVHNDLHLGNLMLSNDRIIIIDFGASKFNYSGGESDYDLYSIKNELLKFFLKQEEINKIFKNIDLKKVNFEVIKKCIMNELPKKSLQVDKNTADLVQLFFNRISVLILNLVRDKISSSEIKGTIQQLRDSKEKSYFGIEITQRNEGFQSKIDFLNQKYILITASYLSGTSINLKKNNKDIDSHSFSNIIDLLHDLKEFVMKNFGFEIHIPDVVPFCEINLKNKIYQIGEMKYKGTESLELSFKNNNDYSITLLELGINVASVVFHYEKDVEIESNHTFIRDIPYYAFKRQLEKSNIEKPFLLRGYAKLSTREEFFSDQIEVL